MNSINHEAFRQLIGGTNHPVDNARNVMAIRACGDDTELRAEVIAMICERRKQWQNWLFVTQRKWQDNRRTVTEKSCANRRARWGNTHDAFTILRAETDSVNTRENYVRCKV